MALRVVSVLFVGFSRSTRAFIIGEQNKKDKVVAQWCRVLGSVPSTTQKKENLKSRKGQEMVHTCNPRNLGG